MSNAQMFHALRQYNWHHDSSDHNSAIRNARTYKICSGARLVGFATLNANHSDSVVPPSF
jgi:hypothetical protein